MRAYVLEHYGNPEGSRLMDVPAPTPRPGDILVEVRAAGLNPVDFKFRQGKLRAILRPKLPSKGVPNSIMLAKPFAPAQLVTAVAQLLNGGTPAA